MAANILVTGATGFLGSALCERLIDEGHTVVPVSTKNCDLRQQKALDLFNGTRFDTIFHLAAWTQAGDFCLHHPGEQWVINQQINTNLLAWWCAHQPKATLIAMGTSCAYDPELEPIEANYLAGRPIDSLFTYAMGKRMLYTGMIALHKQFGLNYLCLIPSTLYGPGYHTDERQLHFIFDLIRKILRGKYFGEPVVLWGDGYQTRELVYIDDFIEIALHLTKSARNEIFNVGANEHFTIREFAAAICRQVDFDFNAIRFDPSKYVGATKKFIDTRKLAAHCPEFEFTPLVRGLEKTIDWFKRAFQFGTEHSETR